MTPRRTLDRIWRTSSCLFVGNSSIMRPIVSRASTVCIVESTR